MQVTLCHTLGVGAVPLLARCCWFEYKAITKLSETSGPKASLEFSLGCGSPESCSALSTTF